MRMRRWMTIMLPVIATATLAVAGTWVLITWLAVRDHLGTWKVTLQDEHGAVVGTGRLTLVAEQWHAYQAPSPPWVGFYPTLSQDGGEITFTPAGMRLLASQTSWRSGSQIGTKPTSLAIRDARCDGAWGNSIRVTAFFDTSAQVWNLSIDDIHEGGKSVTIYYNQADTENDAPLTGTVSR
jgi:hypothetical protein